MAEFAAAAASAIGSLFTGGAAAGATASGVAGAGISAGSALTLGAAGALAGSLLARKPDGVKPPPPMPLPQDAASERARRNDLGRQRQRAGRMSTILTGQDDTLG